MQINRIKSKSVGDVRIFEIFGDFATEFAKRGKEAMAKTMRLNKRANVLYNINGVQNLDEAGLESLLDEPARINKRVIWTRDQKFRDLLKGRTQKDILFAENEMEIVKLFEREFAEESPEESFLEKRRFIRLKTVLPLQFWTENDKGEKVEFFAVVSNLSEGGLFAEFIQSSSEEKLKHHINPYDLKLLSMKLFLNGTSIFPVQGKLIHGSVADGGIGVEFYGIEEKARLTIKDWVAGHLTKMQGETL